MSIRPVEFGCCLCSVAAVCLHVCEEGIRWEDSEHPGPAEKTVSVCHVQICYHLCFINSSLDRRDVHSVRLTDSVSVSLLPVLSKMLLLRKITFCGHEGLSHPQLSNRRCVLFFLCRHRLYQEDCACVLGHYIKDLRVLGRDLAKTVVLDNAPHTYPYHVSTVETIDLFDI